MKKPIKMGGDLVRGPGWRPLLFTRRGAERFARLEAEKKSPKGMWHGFVAEHPDYFRVNIGGQPFGRRPR
jgi:hypothetical protein